MQRAVFVAVLLYQLAIATVAHAQLDGPSVEWLRDIDEARMVAAGTGRDVFVLFTGRGWCQPCEILDQRLFHDADFVSRLQELCVPVELDFNFGDSSTENVREARFRNWAKHYLVHAYPTMVFMDSSGRPFFVAQFPDCEAASFLTRIEQAIANKKLRDEHFALAESADGIERAQHVHSGLSAVADQLTSIEDRHSDPLLTFYADEVVTIMTTQSDDGALSAIHEFYCKRRAACDDWLRKNRIWERIAEMRKSSRFDEGIDLLNGELKTASSDEYGLSLFYTLIEFLTSAKRFDDAISRIDEKLAQPELHEHTSRRLWSQKVMILYNADRKGDAYSAIEQWIAASEVGSRARLEALELKGVLLHSEKPASAEAIKACEAFRDAAEPDTFEYLSASAYLARCEHAAGNSRRAAALWDEILSVLERQRDGEVVIQWPWNWDAVPGVMIQAAEVHAAAKNLDVARELLNRAETEIERKAQTVRESTTRDVESLRARLMKARQSIPASKRGDSGESDEREPQ